VSPWWLFGKYFERHDCEAESGLCRRTISAQEHWNIAAFRNFNAQLIGTTTVVFEQLGPQAARIVSNDGVKRWFEVHSSVVHGHRDPMLRKLVGVPG